MNPPTPQETAREQAKVMLAYAHGRKIERRNKIAGGWEHIDLPMWDWLLQDYRVAPGQFHLPPDHPDLAEPEPEPEPAATTPPPLQRYAFSVAVLDEALATNRVPHVRTDIVTVDAPTPEHATGVALQQIVFDCVLKQPQSALLHYRMLNVERLSLANPAEK